MPRKFKEILVGDIIGDMTVVQGFRDYKNNRRMLKVRCNICGREHDVYEGNLRDKPGASSHKSECSKTIRSQYPEFYQIYQQAKGRITNPNNHAYNRYGGRGLEFGYDSPVDFFDDQYTRYIRAKEVNPGKKISIDRMNNNLGYIRGNISWTTSERQTRNSTRVRKFIAIAPDGQVYITNNQTMFGQNHGLEPKHISDCLRGLQATTGGGWRFEEIDMLFEYQFDNDPTIIKELYY